MLLAVVLLLAGALATARLTRLMTADRITRGVRDRIVGRYGSASLPAYLVFCPWCQSMYFGLPVAAAVVAAVPALRPTGWTAVLTVGLLWLAYSHLTGLLAGLDEED